MAALGPTTPAAVVATILLLDHPPVSRMKWRGAVDSSGVHPALTS
jgi:hypothetical protein